MQGIKYRSQLEASVEVFQCGLSGLIRASLTASSLPGVKYILPESGPDTSSLLQNSCKVRSSYTFISQTRCTDVGGEEEEGTDGDAAVEVSENTSADSAAGHVPTHTALPLRTLPPPFARYFQLVLLRNRLMPQNDAGALSRTGLRCSRIPEVL
ncbi:uncharacterized [Tachysurus ichikawai]